jgi:hypothetical protein
MMGWNGNLCVLFARTPPAILERITLCRTSSRMETMLFLLGLNRSPLYQAERVYCDRVPRICMASFGSLVTRSFGPTRARDPSAVYN